MGIPVAVHDGTVSVATQVNQRRADKGSPADWPGVAKTAPDKTVQLQLSPPKKMCEATTVDLIHLTFATAPDKTVQLQLSPPKKCVKQPLWILPI